MSSVAFHSPDGTVRIGGAERHFAGWMCRRLFESVLGIDEYDMTRPDGMAARIYQMLDPGHYAHPSQHRPSSTTSQHLNLLHTALAPINYRGTLRWNKQDVDILSLHLNTALAIGSDAVKFATRMHGQCEIHGYVTGPNRAWLADIIDEGSASGVLRKPYQTQYEDWHAVSALLRDNEEMPVVMSYSVCESFPPWSEKLDDQVPWDQAFHALRRRSGSGHLLELKPDDWKVYRFGHRLSALDLVHDDWKGRLDAAFPSG